MEASVDPGIHSMRMHKTGAVKKEMTVRLEAGGGRREAEGRLVQCSTRGNYFRTSE
jgi:hypothetical protein